jgi:arginine deiminase
MKTILYHLQTIVKDAMELFDNIFSTTYVEMEHFKFKKIMQTKKIQ